MGKMLRARLTLSIGSATDLSDDNCLKAAATVEMVHLASLLHDDVIDNGLVRRGKAAFWKEKGSTSAILMGDYILCRAFSLISEIGNTELMSTLINMLQEVCNAELEQELIAEDLPRDWGQCLNVARRKTGSLFAYASYAGAGNDTVLATALLESGFELGTAYQLADDLLDAGGNFTVSDKTLGQDARQNKLTAADFLGTEIDPVKEIYRLTGQAEKRLQEYPEILKKWISYVDEFFQPVIDGFISDPPPVASFHTV
jgi:octaprenyl-diphosphate synthase